MKLFLHISLITAALAVPTLQADDGEDRMEAMDRHSRGSEKLADEQDELSADVQQLVIEQTAPKVIELLTDVEGIMDETTDYLVEADTGGVTIAAQTEIIEKIHEAAKAKQKKSGSGEAGGAMMDMMERMMGKTPGGDKPGKEGEKPGDQGGEGMTGESDAANERTAGDPDGRREERTLKKASGTAGRNVPAEFKKAFDAFNRGSEDLAK